MLLEVEADCGIVDDVGDVLGCVELASVKDVVVGSIGEVDLEFVGSGADQHVVHEESVVGTSAHYSDFDPFFGAPAGISIDHVDSSAGI